MPFCRIVEPNYYLGWFAFYGNPEIYFYIGIWLPICHEWEFLDYNKNVALCTSDSKQWSTGSGIQRDDWGGEEEVYGGKG